MLIPVQTIEFIPSKVFARWLAELGEPMNPPFANGADVEHALSFLAPCWVLVALCANGPRQQASLRPLATTWEGLPDGTFASKVTNVRAAMMTVRR
jgi:hypothetical protein